MFPIHNIQIQPYSTHILPAVIRVDQDVNITTGRLSSAVRPTHYTTCSRIKLFDRGRYYFLNISNLYDQTIRNIVKST